MPIETIIVAIPAVLLALTVHEYAHGWVANLCGDSTAKDYNRLTLNPMAHLDPLGTIMMIGTIVTNFIPFGWAKPVPIDPRNFRSLKRDLILVSFAGPLSNIILASISGSILASFKYFPHIPFQYELSLFLMVFFQVNISLFLFNLIPIPPLDGSKILMGILPDHLNRSYIKNSNFLALAFVILLVLESTIHVKTISYILSPIWNWFYNFWYQLFF